MYVTHIPFVGEIYHAYTLITYCIYTLSKSFLYLGALKKISDQKDSLKLCPGDRIQLSLIKDKMFFFNNPWNRHR